MPIRVTALHATGSNNISRYLIEQHQKGLIDSYTREEALLIFTTHFGAYETVICPEIMRTALEYDLRVEVAFGPLNLPEVWQKCWKVTDPQTHIKAVLRLRPGRQ